MRSAGLGKEGRRNSPLSQTARGVKYTHKPRVSVHTKAQAGINFIPFPGSSAREEWVAHSVESCQNTSYVAVKPMRKKISNTHYICIDL